MGRRRREGRDILISLCGSFENSYWGGVREDNSSMDEF